MRTRRAMHRALSLLCCLAMLMAWLPVLPAAAENTTVLFREDFESYAVGEDTFYKADESRYIYYETYHGMASAAADASYSTYGITSDGGNKVLDLTSHNTTRNYFLANVDLTGAYAIQFDFQLKDPGEGAKSTSTLLINPFQGYSFPQGNIMVYIDGKAGARITDETSGTATHTYLTEGGTRVDTTYGNWYTAKIGCEPGKITLKVWSRGGQEPADSAAAVVNNAAITQALQAKNDIRIHNLNRNQPGYTYGVMLDELTVTGTGTSSSSGSSSAGSQTSSTPADAGDYGDREWAFFTEDFESFPVGEDTFFNADKDHYTYFSSYHGTPSDAADASYSTYGINSADGSKVLDLTSYNTTRNYFLVKTDMSGSYDVQLDFQLKDPGTGASSASTLLLNPFQGYSFSHGTIMVYIDGRSGARITDETSGSAVHTYLKKDGATMALGYGKWFTVKLTCRPGSLAMKVWEKGGQEPADSEAAVVSSAEITQALSVSAGNSLRVQNLNRSQPGYAYGVMLDNLKVSKPFKDISVQSVAFGVPGQKLSLTPAFTGQDLSAQRPAPQYKWTPADAELGTMNEKGELVLGPKQGQTTLTLELLDVRGNGTGVTCTTDLVVGVSNGVTPDTESIRVEESAIGTTRKITLSFSDEVKAKYPTPVVEWTSTNEAVAKVDAAGLITFVGFGSAAIVGMVKDNGEDTMYYTNITVQVGETPLRVLSIGNSYSRDSLYYLSSLAALYGKRIEACYLEKASGTLRQAARNVAQDRAEYSYWKSNAMTGELVWQATVTIDHAMSDGAWDVILLQQGPEEAGIPTTFNTDLDFMLDYVADVQPQAKVYWNMTWAYQQDISGSRTTNFKNYFNSSQAIMYNAIVDCVDKFIVGKDAKFGSEFDGWLPVGAAVQNLRAAMGDTITRDGYHLSLQAGRLAAAMTVLKTLYPDTDLSKITPNAVASFLVTDKTDINALVSTDPDYANTEANMAMIRAAVEAACKDLTKAPAKIDAPAQPRIEDDTQQGDITIAQVGAPLKLHFPDLTVLRDGTVLVSAYEHIFHVPNETLGEYFGKEGSGRLVIWKSTDNGQTYEELLSIDEELLEEWGIAETSNRYERWKNGENDYTFIADARDPNFGLVYFDITGDGKEDEVILYTFDMVDYHENRRGHTLAMTWSIDGGKTWAKPMEINGKTSATIIKRGDIASFSDGQIMVPTYLSNKIYLLLMDWNADQQKWVLTHETIMPDFDPEETGNDEFNEMSLIAPDPDGDVIYGYIRANGTVVKSYDRGRTWELIGNEAGLIHQPGFAYIDENRMFVTWARTNAPRTVYGKVFYYNGDWDDTATRTIYASPVTSSHDMADPSCKLLANGKILSVCYDVAYRSIVGTFDDPNSSEFALLEMNQDAKQATIYENNAPGGSTVTVSETLPSGYTAYATAAFSAGGKLTVKLGSGASVTFAEGQNGIEAGKTYNVAVLTNGSSVYTKVWAEGTQETDAWVSVTPASGTADGTIVYSGSGITLNSVKVTTRIAITMSERIHGIAGGPGYDLDPLVQPAQSSMVWTTSDPAVATVENGVVTFVGQGTAVITLNAGGAIACVTVDVDPVPAELSGEGETTVIFADDYETYTVGTNTFWDALESSGYLSNGSDPSENRSYNVLAENGNQYLQLTTKNGKATWHKVNVPITGNYTVQYDFLFTGARVGFDSASPGHYLYMNLWQDSDIHGFAVLAPEGVRVEYIPEGSSTVTYDPGKLGLTPVFDLNKWHTIKVVRIDGGIYVKVWERGTAEPAEWNLVSLHKELDSSASSCFRMQYYAGGVDQERTVSIDNLSITQQVTKGAHNMKDVASGAWYYNAVDYVLKNGIMGGYNATTFGPEDNLTRAMLVQMLYNREGAPALTTDGRFTDVKSSDWYFKAVTWAAEQGVVGGYGDIYKPDQNITRQELAQMLYNYAGKPAVSGDLSRFADADKVDGWAVSAITWATEHGVMGGKGGGYLDPLGKATRAEAAQMLKNFIENVANG